MTSADGALVTVIIPVYNTEAYLDRCVTSVRQQSYSNLEIIQVDDGSSDRCPGMCDAFACADPRISVIHQANAGAGVARNTALDVARGEFIMFVDSDDYIQPDMVQELVSVAQEDAADLALCGFRLVDDIRTVDHIYHHSRMQFDNESLMRDYLSLGATIGAPWAKLYRRHLFNEVRFPSIRYREDSYVMHEILGQAKKATFVPEPLYVQCVREDSTERKPFDTVKLDTVLEIAERLLDYTSRHYPELVQYAHYRKAHYLASLMLRIQAGPQRRSLRPTYRVLQSQLQEELAILDGFSLPENSTFLLHAASDDLVFRLRCMRFAAAHAIKRLLARLRPSAQPS